MMADFKELYKQFDEKRAEFEDAQYNLRTALVEWLGTYTCEWELTIGEWECENSPIGVCFYNKFEDKPLDNCLVCHEPHERK
jgi:hypothetical protein